MVPGETFDESLKLSVDIDLPNGSTPRTATKPTMRTLTGSLDHHPDFGVLKAAKSPACPRISQYLASELVASGGLPSVPRWRQAQE